MNNVGSIFRTADAFRLEGLVLCGITARPPHPDIHKTALGAEDSVSWRYATDSLEAVRQLREGRATSSWLWSKPAVGRWRPSSLVPKGAMP